MKKIQDAAPMRNEQFLAFQGFEATIPVKLVAQWRAAVELWEQDPTAPNPFKVEKQCKNTLLLYFAHADIAFYSGFGAANSAAARTRGRRGCR